MTKVNPLVEYGIRKPLVALSKAPGMDIVRRNFRNKNMAFINGLAITSIIAKDGLGCYMYVNQSLHNDKIPDDKRKFVAALDLANGGLMIAMQLLMFFTVSNKNVQKKMFNALFGKVFNSRSAQKGYQALVKNIDSCKGMTGPQFHEAFGKTRKVAEDAFSYVTSLAAATIVGKRVIVPFIATPLADKTKAWMSKNDKPAVTHPETKNTYSEHPSMKGAQKNSNAENTETNLIERYKHASHQ